MDEKNDKLSPKPENEKRNKKKTLKEKLFIKSIKPKMPKMNGIKIAYAIAVFLALGGALSARLTANNALNDVKATFPEDNYTLPNETLRLTENMQTEEPDFEVRQNLTDVPDTRANTETEPSEANKTTEQPTEDATSPYAEPFTQSFILPLGTDISKNYSPTAPIYNSTMGDWRTHTGIDFSGDSGAQIKAVAYGTVTKIYDDALYGTVIEIDHGNEVIAKYCGINKDTLEVKAKDTVKAGALIGYLGEVPCEKDDISHLHFEIIYKGSIANPLEIMGK